jgi:diamine N-acetyltransferase
MIHLKEVTPDNWRLGLSVSEEQKNFVSDSNRLLARAWAYKNHRSNAFVIYDDDTPVGMALYYDYDEGKAYDFCQLFIDHRYQGKGFGLEAARQILELMKSDGKYDRVILCYIDGNEAAKRMYEKLGFTLTGDADGDEIIMEQYFA